MGPELRAWIAVILIAWLPFASAANARGQAPPQAPGVSVPINSELTPAVSRFPRTFDPKAEVRLPKHEVDAFVYEQVLLYHVNTKKDFATLMKMEVLADLRTSHPEAPREELIKLVNTFDAKLKARQAEAATGRDARWDGELQMLKDAAEVAQTIPKLKAIGTAGRLAHTYAEVGLRYYNAFTAPDRRVGAQETVAGEARRARQLREQIVTRFREAQERDPRIRSAAKALIDPVVDASPEEDARALLAHNPQLEQHVTVQGLDQKLDAARSDLAQIEKFLEDHIQKEGDLFVRIEEMYERTAMDLNILKGGIKQTAESIASMHKSQTVMFNYLLAKDVAAEKAATDRRTAEEEAAVQQITMQGLRSSSRLMTRLLATFDEPSARRFSVVSQSVLDVAETLQQYEKTMKVLQTMDKARDGVEMAKVMGTAMMAAGVLGAGLAVVSMFADSGPSADQMILEQLAALSMQIQDLRKEMHDRFDRIDRRLNQMFEAMVDGFDAVLDNQATTLEQLDIVKTQLLAMAQRLNEMSATLRLIDERIVALGADVFEHIRTKTISQCIARSGAFLRPKMSDELFQQCFLEVVDLAAETALRDTIRGGPLSAQAPLDAVTTTRRLAEATAKNLNLLHRVASEPEYRVDALANITTKSLPNLMYWTTGVQSLHDVLHLWPDQAKSSGVRLDSVLQRVRTPGDEARRFLGVLQSEEFVKKLFDAYEKSLEDAAGENGLEFVWRTTMKDIVGKETRPLAEFHNFDMRRIRPCGDAQNDERYPDLAISQAISEHLPLAAKQLHHLKAAAVELCYEPILQSSDKYYPAYQKKTDCKREVRRGANCKEVDCYMECVEWNTEQVPARCIGNVRVALRLSAPVGGTTYRWSAVTSNLNETIELTQLAGRELCDGYVGSDAFLGWLKARGGALQAVADGLTFSSSFLNRGNRLDNAIRSRAEAIVNIAQRSFAARMATTLDATDADPGLRERLLTLTYRYAALEAFLRAAYLHGIARHDPLRASLYGAKSIATGESLAAEIQLLLPENQRRVVNALQNDATTADTIISLLVPDAKAGVLSPPLGAAVEAQRATVRDFRSTFLEALPMLKNAEPLAPTLALEELTLVLKAYPEVPER